MKKSYLLIFSIFILSLSLSPKAFSEEVDRENRIDRKTLMMQERKERFAESLDLIKDERKKKIIERMNDNFESRNEKWVVHFNNVLRRLAEILEKIETRTERAKENGKDMTSVEAAIARAQTAIDEAQSAVNSQQSKDYTIEITNEEKAKDEVATVKNLLKSDLTSAREKVKNARDAVHQAAITLGENL